MSSLGCGCDNAGKKLVITFSLIMRLLEWSKEEAKDDVALHQMMEKLMAFNDGVNPLGIEVYDCLIKDANGSSVSEEESDEEGKVDTNFADYIQNIHDSYYEGGITGDHAKECIGNYCQDESMDNCDTISYEDIECCRPSCCANVCPEGEQGNGAVFTITSTGDIEDGECQGCEEELPKEIQDQMIEIINLAKC